MAEVVGLVASGISIAQIAGEILSTGLKVKRILNELNETPDTLGSLLSQIQFLVPILDEIMHNNTSEPVSHSLDEHLQNAVVQCQIAAKQLDDLARELLAQIESSRGLRRRMKAMSVLSKKDLLNKYESRLNTTIQLLAVIQQTYILTFQRMQPQLVASHVLKGLQTQSMHPREVVSPVTEEAQVHDVRAVTTHRRRLAPTGPHVDSWYSDLVLGTPFITGTIEISRPPNHPNLLDSGDNEQQEPRSRGMWRFRLQMPPWLCATVIDSALYRSLSGWNHHFSTYRVHFEDTDEWRDVRAVLRSDDINAVRRLFQERKLSALDHAYVQRRYNDYGTVPLLAVAIALSAWKSSRYLLDRGSGQGMYQWHGAVWLSDTNTQLHYQHFLEHDDLGENIRISLITSFCGDVESFTRLRRTLWPDYEFYADDFRLYRHRITAHLTTGFNVKERSAYPAIFRLVAYGHPDENKANLNWQHPANHIFLHSLGYAIGLSAWSGPEVAESWYQIAKEVLLSNRELNTPQYAKWPGAKVFLYLFSEALDPPLLPGSDKGVHKMSKRLNRCSEALRTWLSLLYECGFDLEDLGPLELESSCRRYPCRIRPPETIACGHDSYDRMDVELITFDYGPRVQDWKLWWAEPTDKFAGDFWGMVEPEALLMPGSWIEDNEDNI